MGQKITKNMKFGELLKEYPDAAPILGNYGLHCVGCRLSVHETIEQGMKAHGLDEAAIEKLVLELNKIGAA